MDGRCPANPRTADLGEITVTCCFVTRVQQQLSSETCLAYRLSSGESCAVVGEGWEHDFGSSKGSMVLFCSF